MHACVCACVCIIIIVCVRVHVHVHVCKHQLFWCLLHLVKVKALNTKLHRYVCHLIFSIDTTQLATATYARDMKFHLISG